MIPDKPHATRSILPAKFETNIEIRGVTPGVLVEVQCAKRAIHSRPECTSTSVWLLIMA